MLRFRFLAGLLVLCLTAGCKAQSTAPAGPDPVLDRRIEIMVRARYEMPADVTITLGARTPSQFTGYETLPVTITHGSNAQVVSFLISTDNKKLVHLDTFDLTKDPADAVPIAGRPIRGNPAAKVTVVNFDDLECGYCARLHAELFPDTLDRYKSLVRFVYKDDPLTDIHPWAMHAAVDANCLAAQSGDVYWTYVDYLHAHGGEITGSDRDLTKSFAALDRIAQQEATLGKLDETTLNACIAKQDQTQILASAKLAVDLGVEGTPATFVNGEKVNGGAVPTDEVWAVIDRALRALGEQPPPAPVPAPTQAPAAPAAAGAGK